MYFEGVFIKPNDFYMNIFNMNLSKKFMKIAFLASKVGRSLKLPPCKYLFKFLH